MDQLKVVVTGATGNLGTQVVRRLLAEPAVASVIGVCRRVPEQAVGDSRLTYRTADLADREVATALSDAFAGADAVIHLAWRIQPSHDRATMRRVNVDGTRAVVDAMIAERVPALVHASSLGAYGPSAKHQRRDETWPTSGIPTSTYSRHKAEVEALLDAVEADHPQLRVVRMRPALVLQADAGSEIARYFLGPLVPVGLLRPALIPVVPDLPGMRFQVVHTEDVADAFVRATLGDARGAFNLATEPVLDAHRIAALLHAKVVPVPKAAARTLLTATWRLRVMPTDAGWLDMGLETPLMDTARAREELGWSPRHDAETTLLELIDGIAHRSGAPTPPLHELAAAPRRALDVVRRLATGGIGA